MVQGSSGRLAIQNPRRPSECHKGGTIKGFDAGHVLVVDGRHDVYTLTLWEQPWFRILWYKLYHWYDTLVFKLPGFRRFEQWLHNRSRDPWYIPISSRQDMRCYDLMVKGRTTIVTIEIPHDTYKHITGEKNGNSME